MQTSIKERKGIVQDIKNLTKEPSLLITILITFAWFGLFIIYPFAKITLLPEKSHWVSAFTDKRLLEAFWHTILSSTLSTATATILGFIYAYTLNYTRVPGKKFMRIVALLPTMAPSVVTGLAFIMLFGRRGIITYKMLHLTVDLYGWVGLWIVQTIAFFPLAYITISGVLKSISPNLELAAQNLGATGFTLFRTVTLKLATPGIASAFLLVAINALADFGNPMLIGGNYNVLATEAYTQVTGMWNLPLAAALSMLLVIPTILVFFIQKYYIDRKSFVTVTGKPVSGLNRDIVSKKGTVILYIICLLMDIVILLVIGIVVCFAFTKAFGANNLFTLSNFNEGVIKSKPMRNSWMFSIIAAFLTTIIGVILGFLVTRKKFPGKNIVDFLAMLPVSLPGTFIGLSLIMSFNGNPLNLTGTMAIVIIGMTIRQVPVGYRNAVAGFKQIDKSIEEAATNLGGSSVKTFINVVLPMLKNAFSVSFVYTFMKCMNTLSTVIFLISPKWMLASVSILNLADHGFYGVASATAIGMMAVIFLTFGIVKLIFRDKINIFDL